MRKLAAVAVVLGSVVLLAAARPGQSDDVIGGAFPTEVLLAQANAAQPAAAGAAAPARPRRLPNYYGQVNLSPRQRETIYELQAKYNDQIEQLERQIAALRAKRDQEIEAVLTAQQKQRLRQLIEAAALRRAGARSQPAAPQAAPAVNP